jgi:hypothetical protein
MQDRNREADLDVLAGKFYEYLDYDRGSALGLDSKRPFGWSGPVSDDVLVFLGFTSEYEGFPREQTEYAESLWSDLRDHLRRRWRER